jgi:hypothetical protein
MASESIVHKLPLPVAADYSSNQFYLMGINTSGQFVLGSTQGQHVMGPLLDKPDTAGDLGTVATLGECKVKLGGTVDEGQPLTVDASGQAIAATDPDEHVWGRCVEAGVSGDIRRAYITHESAVSAGSASGVLGALQYAEVTVTDTEIKAINASPKTLVAAPGAGYCTEFVSAVLILDYNSAAYVNNGILGVYETDSSGNLLSGTLTLANFLGLTADTIKQINPAAEATPSLTGVTMAENKALVLTAATGETITGDSPVRVKIAYRIHATGL